MALYGPAVKRLIPPGPNDPKIKPRVVILHVAVSEAASLYAYFNGPSGGVESHFYIRRDGTVEQYRDTAHQADANTDANDFAISIETQGMERGEWTAQQLDAIKALLLWCHNTHGIPLVRCPAWDGSGVGYHTLFPGRWDKRGASCPGPDRKLQFNKVLEPWMRAGGNQEWFDMPIPDEDLKRIADYVWAAKLPRTNNPDVAARDALGEGSINIWRALQRLKALEPDDLTSAVAAGIQAAGATTDVNALAKAIVLELGKDS